MMLSRLLALLALAWLTAACTPPEAEIAGAPEPVIAEPVMIEPVAEVKRVEDSCDPEEFDDGIGGTGCAPD